MTSDAPSQPGVVIDTNTVLDWLLFDDPRARPLAQAVQSGALRWCVCVRMRDEFERTLGCATLSRWSPDAGVLLAAFDRWSNPLDDPPPCADAGLRCSDPDDRVFVDLARAAGATWLVTHDRALLRLARRARLFGLLVTRPQDWPPT